jgi:hypothetical protein
VRRAISVVVTALLAVAVVSTIFAWTARSSGKPPRVVRGVVGSDLKDFFADPQVRAEFAERGIDVQVDARGNAPIATTPHRSKFDFAFGAATSNMQTSTAKHYGTTSYVLFRTPMAVATFTDVAEVLQRAGVAHEHSNWWTLDMKGLLDLVARRVRWNDLAGGTGYPPTQIVLTTSTDVTSTSAVLYASIASYVANQDRVLKSPASVNEVINEVSPLFLGQPHNGQSTEALFADYLSRREDTTLMVMIPEAQYVVRAAARDHSIRPNMVLMYPDPDVLSKYTLVPLDAAGDTVGRLLSDDPILRRLAVEHGFRTTSKPAMFSSFAQRNKLAVEPDVIDGIGLPTSSVLEALMTRIDAALHVTLGPRPGPAASNE